MKKLAFILLIFLFSCEFEETPNLIVGNHFADGWLYIKYLPSYEVMVNERLSLFCEKNLFLDIGIYQARLVADQGQDPRKQDRTIIVHIPSQYYQVKILFK